MSHNLDKFYSSFAGIDARSNKLLANPKTFRQGSKNFRYNFQDEIQNRQGFQHKSLLGFTSVGDIEYRYTDLDTGEAKSQYLAVSTAGDLYKKRYQYIEFSSLGTATSYSFYYDEASDDFKLKFNSYAAITVSTTMTMDELRIAINALGATCTVVDESETTVTGSTKLAYYLDVVINKELSVGVVNEMNSQYWDLVSSGGSTAFPTTRDFYTDPNYNGISYVNINNACIITDGGFPMKYDGYVVYRVGQPKILAPKQPTDPDLSLAGTNYNYSGIFLGATVRPDYSNINNVNVANKVGMDDNGTYQYVFQLGSVDAQGVTVMGGYDVGAENLYIKQTLLRGQNAVSINIPAITGNFNWFRCRIKGDQNIADGGGTLDVYPGHNLVSGLTLRVPVSNRQLTCYFGSASLTNASQIVNGLLDTSRIQMGSLVTGTGIPSDTHVLSVDSETQITLTRNATSTATSTLTIETMPGMSYLMSKISSASSGYSGDAVTTSGSPIITGIDTSNVAVGGLVEGLNIPLGSRVLTIDSSTQVTINNNATGSGSIIVFDIYGTLALQKGISETELTGSNSMQYPFQSANINQQLNTTSGSTSIFVGLAASASFDTTSGSPTITLSAPNTNIKVGMFIRNGPFAASTKVLRVNSATEIVATNNASATTTTLTGAFHYDYTGYYIHGPGVSDGTLITSQTDTGATITPAATSNQTLIGHMLYKQNSLLIDGQTVSGGYALPEYQNTITDVNTANVNLPQIYAGCFIRVWRSTKDTDLLYHLIDLDIPLVNTAYVDTLPDTQIINATVSPTYVPTNQTLSRISLVDADQGDELPRACKYLSKWQNYTIQMGRPVDTTIKDQAYPTFYGVVPNNDWGDPLTTFVGATYTEAALCDYQSIYWNSEPGSEGFPRDGLHEFKIESVFDDEIRGGSPNKDAFFAFKARSTGLLTGDVAQNNIQLEILEGDIGCASHKSIVEVGGSLVWLDAVNGFYSCVAGRLPVPIGFPIQDYQKINTLNLDWTKAAATNFRKENLYICTVENTIFVFDYAVDGLNNRNCWYIWDGIAGVDVLANSSDDLYLDDGTNQWKMKLTGTNYDMTDHKTAVSLVLNTAWNTQGAPTIDKQYINLWVNSIQGGFTLDFYQYQNFLDYSIAELLGVSFLAESSAKKLVKVPYKAANPKMSGVSFGMRNAQKNKMVKIQGYEIEYAASYETGEPRK